MKRAISIFLFFLMAGFLIAQEKTHTVQAQETVYGISKQYGVSQDDLKAANPFLMERGLQIGDVLQIPGKSGGKSDGQIKTVVTTTDAPAVFIPEEDANFIYIQVKPKQTIYSLTKEYSISEDALKSLNPQLEDGLKADDVIRIPKKKNQTEEITPEGMYKVQKGDTVFSLASQFGVSQDDFYILNPRVQKDGLIVDSYVKVPKKGKSTAVIQDGFIEHKVKQGETIYSITKLYDISFSDLLKNNPELSEGLKLGMTLKIPLSADANILTIKNIKRINDNEINIALLLPFHLNDSKGSSQEKKISTDLLIGAKMALDSLAHKGKRINLTVLDSENQSSSVENLLASKNFSKYDAIVGPLFASNFKALAGMLNDSGIALVSPLSNSEDLKEFQNVLIATPNDEAIADAIINEIRENYKGQQIQILTDERHQNLANYVSGQLKRTASNEISITTDVNKLNQKSETVNETLADGTVVKTEYFTPIITVLVSDNNALGTAYVNKIKKMDAENLQAYGVKFVSAYDIYNEKNKGNIAALKNIGFAFGTVRLVNIYGTNERATLKKFLDIYCETPNEYQQVGFDILYDLVDRMNSKGDVLNALGSEQTRLSTKFKYDKEGKAYVNKAVRIVRLFVPADESPADIEDLND
jgi:LysM repeat protein